MYISTYISSATFAWSSKLTVDIDSTGPDLRLLGGQFSNFFLGKVSTEFKLHGMSIFHEVKVTGLLNFRQLAKLCMLAAMTAAPLRGFLVIMSVMMVRIGIVWHKLAIFEMLVKYE